MFALASKDKSSEAKQKSKSAKPQEAAPEHSLQNSVSVGAPLYLRRAQEEQTSQAHKPNLQLVASQSRTKVQTELHPTPC